MRGLFTFSSNCCYIVLAIQHKKGDQMKEHDVYEAIIEIGRKRGNVTYDEINDALPPEFFSLEELEKFVRQLQGMGVRLTPRTAAQN